MIKRFSKHLSTWLIQNGSNPAQENVYAYGIECLTNELLSDILLFICGFFMHKTMYYGYMVYELFCSPYFFGWLPCSHPCTVYFNRNHSRNHQSLYHSHMDHLISSGIFHNNGIRIDDRHLLRSYYTCKSPCIK